MSLKRKETTTKSVEVSIDNLIKTFVYIQEEVVKHYSEAKFEASMSKSNHESVEELLTPNELKTELDDIPDLRLIDSIKIVGYDYTNNFRIEILLETQPVWHRAISINVRSDDRAVINSIDQGVQDKLGYSKNINWLARSVWPYIILLPLAGYLISALVVFSLHLDYKWIWAGAVISLIGLFIPQSKMERFYPAVLLEDKSQGRTNGRILSKDLKQILKWLVALVISAIILRALHLQ